MPSITVFTPTYNRAYVFDKLYESLCKQTNKDFIWLIVDDGSTDSTKEVVKKWISDSKIQIKYILKENGGKHTAHNVGVEKCSTELFVCVDSDDILTEDAIEIILKYWEEEVEKYNILGLVGRKGDFNRNPEGKNWPINIEYEYFNDIYFKHRYKGETMIIFKTDVLKQYAFPVFDKERFVTEAVLYDRLSLVLPFRLINEVLYLSMYIEDGYTKQGFKLHFNNPKGYAYYLKQRGAILKKLKERIKYISRYYAWVKIHNLDTNSFDDIKISFFIMLFGKVLSLHYIKLYSKKGRR